MLVLVLISIVVSFVGIIIHTVRCINNFIVIHNDCIIISCIIPLRCSLCAAPPRPRCSPSCTASSSRTILASRCHISLKHLCHVLNSNRQDNIYKVSRLQGISFQFFKQSLCTAFYIFHFPPRLCFRFSEHQQTTSSSSTLLSTSTFTVSAGWNNFSIKY